MSGERECEEKGDVELASGLYLVATPIGHLEDISVRGIRVLRSVDRIACEDTRITRRLLDRYEIGTRCVTYHEHNAQIRRGSILRMLARGMRVALVSDAGTPLISDPGYKLVTSAIAGGHLVRSIPGACSVLAALQVSGLPTDQFFFGGFLPVKVGDRRRRMEELRHVPGTIILFETGRRLGRTLGELGEVFGARPVAIARELTKIYEDVERGDVLTLSARYRVSGVKGEVVIVMGEGERAVSGDRTQANRLLAEMLEERGISEATREVALLTGMSRREVYALALQRRNGEGDGEE